jgi:hypothetical protein
MATVLISDPAGFNTQRVPVTGVSVSWVVNGSGSCSAEVLSSDLIANGLNDELRGHEIEVENDISGHWGGVITDVQPNGDGTTEIAATDWKAKFDALRIPKRNRALYGPAGTLALQVITESVRQYGTPITVRTADDLGLPVSLPLDGGDLLTTLDALANESGQEWWIDAETKALRWGTKGTDLTGTVQVVEGRHISNWRFPQSIAPVINDLQAFPLNDRARFNQTINVENTASIAAVGRRQGSVGIEGGSRGAHIRNRAIATVNELAALGLAIEFDLLNIDDTFASFREGDTICVLLPTISVQLTVRIMGRSLDDSAVMGCSGIVTERRALA